MKALTPLALLVLMSCTDPSPVAPTFRHATGETRPNFIVVMTDDQDFASARFMPNVQSLLASRGAVFTSFYVTQSVCCPSRASLLTGQFPHNHGIRDNKPPDGGFLTVLASGLEQRTIAVHLQQFGYYTAIVGKYFNGYPNVYTQHVAPGWDEWYVTETGWFNFITHIGTASVDFSRTYRADQEATWGDSIIRRAPEPFFLYMAPNAPHYPARPARRHEGMFAGYDPPIPVSFGEADRSDKPLAVRGRALYADTAEYVALERRRLESLQAVDEMVGRLWNALTPEQRARTYFIFTSDNGHHHGHHGMLEGKNTAYEEDILVPLIILGPGVRSDTITALTANVDLAPTILDLAGVPWPHRMDGRSLAPFLFGWTPPRWRSAVLVDEHHGGQAIRTSAYLYAELPTGEREMYNMHRDPYQMENIADRADPALVARLSARLARLRSCAGNTCF